MGHAGPRQGSVPRDGSQPSSGVPHHYCRPTASQWKKEMALMAKPGHWETFSRTIRLPLETRESRHTRPRGAGTPANLQHAASPTPRLMGISLRVGRKWWRTERERSEERFKVAAASLWPPPHHPPAACSLLKSSEKSSKEQTSQYNGVGITEPEFCCV